jgi:2-polyprenyl-3-methyl-5-hydroxy-6-metoxy-1,4-benzoquinol methylase
MPIEEQIHKAYETYYTHAANTPHSGPLGRLLAAAKRGYLANQFGYRDDVSMLERLIGLLPWIYPGRPPELDLSVMWLAASRRGTLLDVGSGSGWLVRNMESLGWSAQGLDFDPVTVENARVRGMRFHLGDLLSQQFPEGSFDAVTLCHSLEHVSDPMSLLKECRRVLRPGGSLAIATPNTESLGHQLYGKHWKALEPPRHLHLFNLPSLGGALDRAGFRNTRLFTSCRDANGVFMASRSIARSGKYSMTAPKSALTKITGRLAQIVEIAAMIVDSRLGEDLVATAEK